MKKIKTRFALAWALFIGAGMMAPTQADAAGDPVKVTVCHKGNLIQVGAMAAIYHVLYHGDLLGSCEIEPPDDPGSGTGA